MTKYYLEVELELSGTIQSGYAATRTDPGCDDYIEDVDVEEITFEVGGKQYDLLKGLSKEARAQVMLNLTDVLVDEFAEKIFDDQY